MNRHCMLIIDIPGDCVSCPCCTPNFPLECQAMHNRKITKSKPEWCPLIEIGQIDISKKDLESPTCVATSTGEPESSKTITYKDYWVIDDEDCDE